MTPLEFAEALATCLCAQIETDALPPTCFCGVVPGAAATQDYMGDCSDEEPCGMAWVRIVNIYPSTITGQQDITPRNCGKGLGFDVEIGMMRCMSVGDESGGPPTDAEVLDASQTQLNEAMTMRRAVECCTATNEMSVILGQYLPMGPLGGVVGGAWTLHVGI